MHMGMLLVIAQKYVNCCKETIHRGTSCLYNIPLGFSQHHKFCSSQFPSSSLYPKRRGFSCTPACIHILSYFILMLRATLCAAMGLLNHNQLNLGVCIGSGSGREHRRCKVEGGSQQPRNSEGCQVKAGAEERGVTLRRRRGGWVALSSFLYLQGGTQLPVCISMSSWGVVLVKVIREDVWR